MTLLQKENFDNLIRNNLLVSTGCTEPIAIAYAVAIARKTLNEMPSFIELKLSGNLVKNAMHAGIPGTNYRGIKFVASLAALYANPSKGFELLSGLNEKEHNIAYNFSKSHVSIQVIETRSPLYIEVLMKGIFSQPGTDSPNNSRVIVRDTHTSIKLIELNGKSILSNLTAPISNESSTTPSKFNFTVADIFDYVSDLNDFTIFQNAVEMNLKLSNFGKNNQCGLDVGKIYPFGNNSFTRIVSAATSGIDARMSGANLPATACTGSGNQGITITLPIYQTAKELEKDNESTYKAVALGILCAIYIKQNLNVLSSLCGAVIASAGATAGITYLLGGNYHQVEYAIQNILASCTGMFCDGAKSTCALKVAACISMANYASHLAITNTGCISSNIGIVGSDLSKTVENIHLIENNLSKNLDDTLLSIITNAN